MAQRGYGAINVYHDDDDVVAVRSNQVAINLEMGEARETGRTAYIKSTYAARYNFAVRQYNFLNEDYSERKQNMRGGNFFLFNIIAVILFIGSAVVNAYFTQTFKYIIAVPLVISAIYILLTFYTLYIYQRNDSLIHDRMFQVADHLIPDSINKHFKIPLNANIQSREFIAATDGSTTAMISRLRQQYVNVTEIDIMLYDSNYVKYFAFPKESIVHFALFGMLLLGCLIRLSEILKE